MLYNNRLVLNTRRGLRRDLLVSLIMHVTITLLHSIILHYAKALFMR